MLTRTQIDNRGKKREALLAQISELQKQVDLIDAEMMAECTTLGVDILTGKTYEVTWKEQVSNCFNSKAFIADHAALYEAYKRPVRKRPYTFKAMSKSRLEQMEKEQRENASAVPVPAVAITA